MLEARIGEVAAVNASQAAAVEDKA
jgi:hypothetical protein